MSNIFNDYNLLEDEIGPERIVILRDPSINLKAFLVIDNSVYGVPAGGVRMAPDITLNEISRLARAMTLKNCTFRIPLGGAKSGIQSDSQGKDRDLKITSFARLISPYLKENIYSCGADIGTTHIDQRRIYKIAGKLNVIFPKTEFKRNDVLIEDHFTGYGVVFCLETIFKKLKDLKDSTDKPRIILEGFGKVGKSIVLRLKELGFNLMGISTIKGAIYDEDGLNIDELLNLRENFGDNAVNKYESKNLIRIKKEKLFDISSEYPTDFIIPGARPDAINKKNIDQIDTKAIVSAANIPYEEGITDLLEEKGILAFPDFVSNGGAILVETMMINLWTIDKLYDYLKTRITNKTLEILNGAHEKKISTYNFAKNTAIKELDKKLQKRKRKILRLNKKILIV